MVVIAFDLHIHPLGELRYAVNCTLVVAHGCVAYMDVGEEREHGAVSFVRLWNRTTIPKALRLTLHHHKRTLHYVQPRIPG